MRDTGHINSLPTFLLRMFLNVEDIVITDITDMSKGTVEQPNKDCSVGIQKGLLSLAQTAKAFSEDGTALTLIIETNE